MNAIGKRYSYLDNKYVEDINGMCIGAEWQDANGNTFRMLWVDTLCFSPRARYAELLYELHIKPVGLDEYCYLRQHIEPLGSDIYFCDNINDTNFGKQVYEPFNDEGGLKSGVITQVQFFANNFIVNEKALPVSFKQFIYQLISNMQGVNIQ